MNTSGNNHASRRRGRYARLSRGAAEIYTMDQAGLRKALPRLVLSLIAGSLAFLTGGLVVTPAVSCPWVLPFYALTVVPLFLMLLGAMTLRGISGEADGNQVRNGLERTRFSAAALTVLGGLWFISDAIFLFTHPSPGAPGDIPFLLAGLAAALAGGFALYALKGLNAIKKEDPAHENE